MRILVTDQQGVEHELEGLDGWRVMEVIRDWELNIKAECGGACSCATCHVWVDEAWIDKLPGPSEDEEDLLYSTMDQKPTSRLSCQILLNDDLDGLKVTLTPSASKDSEAA
jgi:2Fe-2S ferredoxin